eukprot:scaffold320224_cov18-Tisochrysis_lutea.AAC.1
MKDNGTSFFLVAILLCSQAVATSRCAAVMQTRIWVQVYKRSIHREGRVNVAPRCFVCCWRSTGLVGCDSLWVGPSAGQFRNQGLTCEGASNLHKRSMAI